MDSFEFTAGISSLGNVGLYSYGTALVAYVALTCLAVFMRRGNPLGNVILVASGLTALWAGAVTLSSISAEPLFTLMQITELGRNAGWTAVLLKLIRLRLAGTSEAHTPRRWLAMCGIAYIAMLLLLLAAGPFSRSLPLTVTGASNIAFSAWLAMAVIGLLLLEQYFRNSNEGELWATKHLCVGLGILFAYDFFMYAEALLFRHLDRNLWHARGVVTTMAAILMATSVLRNAREEGSDEPRGIYLSRHVAFHSLTLMASGLYLISMALAAYFIRYLGGSWGGVLQIAFLCAAGLVLVVLLFSGQIRARTRVWLSKNFFSYKYDYRLEWLQFTQTLASGEHDIPHNITRAIANLAKSPAGILWAQTESGRFTALAHWDMPIPEEELDLSPLAHWLEQHQWIIDLGEWRQAPDIYSNLELPPALSDVPRAWLIIPLFFGERLQGILLLKESEFLSRLNWEDRDLLKVAGRQAASQLAQFQADQALVESRQFEAFNRLSAYVIHDLKNILAQLSLVVTNAQKHKHNPAFVDDMVDTVSNSVNRMSNLMAQLRSGGRTTGAQELKLSELLEAVVEECRLREPQPQFEADSGVYFVHCDRDRLHAVFGHLIHNAQDATDRTGSVNVRLRGDGVFAIVDIEDSGEGMDEEFIRNRLFRPFDSTKGLTGMGIGAFESRDFIRGVGGDIAVKSTPGQGSLFSVRIPCSAAAE
ncbi:MAG: PEP-CTERM system histidine kinase PrsK [Halioglobus sp.]|nr:PEP-CTERM system histidine kinase PrsK [Halioglobus sp.]